MFRAAKDAIAGKAAQVYLKGLLARYGEVQQVKLDSEKRTISITVHLNGETAPIEAEVRRYVIHEVRGQKLIEIKECRCSRPWIQSLMEDFAMKRRFELPPWAAAAL